VFSVVVFYCVEKKEEEWSGSIFIPQTHDKHASKPRTCDRGFPHYNINLYNYLKDKLKEL
jgi:hypothetical protein